MTKNGFWGIAGIIFGWLIVRLFTKSFDFDYLLFLLFGFLIGYLVKKSERAGWRDANDEN